MSHTIHATDVFVLGGIDVGEGHRYLSLFTRELGFLRAHAKSAREERSKLRFGLQDFSYGQVSLVEGRDVWRVTGAEEYQNLYYVFASDEEKIALVARVFSLLRRLLAGQEANERLFDILVEGFRFLKEVDGDRNTVHAIECVLVLRALHTLGYIGDVGVLEAVVKDAHLSREIVEALAPNRRNAIAAINQALEASQL